MKYFEMDNLSTLRRQWLCYNRFHLLTFITDILQLLKKFRKSCQSDSISIFDVFRLQVSLFEELERCKSEKLVGGWEEQFLKNVVENQSGSYLHGFKLIKTTTPSDRRKGLTFTTASRIQILCKLI